MTIAEQTRAIRDALQDWAQKEGGKAFVASDLAHMWEMAQASSQSPRVIIAYNGEDIRGEFGVASILGRVDRHFIAMVTRGRGFNAQRGDALTETQQNARPFYDLVEQARDILRALENISVELPVDFRSVKPSLIGELLMDGYQIEFSAATDLPRIVGQSSSTIIPQ